MLVFPLRDIPAGEELLIDYGEGYFNHMRAEGLRAEALLVGPLTLLAAESAIYGTNLLETQRRCTVGLRDWKSDYSESGWLCIMTMRKILTAERLRASAH